MLILVCLGLVIYSYLGYPFVLAAWAGIDELTSGLRFVVGGFDRREPRREEAWPRLSIAFAAHDEASCIRQKVENCLAVDYPGDRLEVLVGCDGCSDGTAALARVEDPRVRVFEFARSGKAAVLSRIVPMAQGDVVLLTDANVAIEAGAAKALVRHFRNARVGAVVGHLRLFNRVKRDFEESAYWEYETILKYFEGKHGCVLGANGGIYAIRRHLFHRLRENTITDDFVVPLRIATRGWKVPFEVEAIGIEETTEDVGLEFSRRVRIGAGNWQSLSIVPELLDPRRGFLAFAFLSHKLLRWLAPFLLVMAFSASLFGALRGDWSAVALLSGQLAFYGLALAGGLLHIQGRLRRAASAAWYFVFMNAALIVGAWRFLRGRQGGAWERTERALSGVRAPSG